eukprot:scpid43528/ scgid13642/ 
MFIASQCKPEDKTMSAAWHTQNSFEFNVKAMDTRALHAPVEECEYLDSVLNADRAPGVRSGSLQACFQCPLARSPADGKLSLVLFWYTVTWNRFWAMTKHVSVSCSQNTPWGLSPVDFLWQRCRACGLVSLSSLSSLHGCGCRHYCLWHCFSSL